MKFHDLNIATDGTFGTYQKITNLLKVIPKEEKEEFSIWTYQIVTNENDEYFDFVNVFLDLLQPNFEALKNLGINIEDINIWLFYEYNKQCSMSFKAQEMKRLGESGISFNIDCIESTITQV